MMAFSVFGQSIKATPWTTTTNPVVALAALGGGSGSGNPASAVTNNAANQIFSGPQTMQNAANQFSGTFNGAGTVSNAQNVAQATNGAFGGNIVTNGQSLITFIPTQIVITNFFALSTNKFIAFGTSPSVSGYAYNASMTWLDSNGDPQTGAFTNSVNTMVNDPTLGAPTYVVGTTPLDVSGFTYFFDTPAYFNYQTLQYQPGVAFANDGRNWNVDSGTGTFAVTNALLSQTISTTNAYTLGFTNTYFDFVGAIRSLPHAPFTGSGASLNQFPGGGKVVIPQGITKIGTNAFLYHEPFSIEICGAGPNSILDITNGDGSTAGLTFGTYNINADDPNTFPAIHIHDLIVVHENDVTNACLKIIKPDRLNIEHLITSTYGALLAGQGQFDGSGYACTNEIGLQIISFNGQMVSLYDINSANEWVGVDISADHLRVYAMDLEHCGGTGGAYHNSWGTNLFALGAGLKINGGYEHQWHGIHSFQCNITALISGAASTDEVFYGGDFGEAGNKRIVSVNPNDNPVMVHDMGKFGGTSPFGNDRMATFSGGVWSISTTNAFNVHSDGVFGAGVTALYYLTLGGNQVFSATASGVSMNGGGGVTNLQGAVNQTAGPYMTTNPVTGGLVPSYNAALFTNLPASALNYRSGFTNIPTLTASLPIVFNRPFSPSIGTNYWVGITFDSTLAGAISASATAKTTNGFTLTLNAAITGQQGIDYYAIPYQ